MLHFLIQQESNVEGGFSIGNVKWGSILMGYFLFQNFKYIYVYIYKYMSL